MFYQIKPNYSSDQKLPFEASKHIVENSKTLDQHSEQLRIAQI